MIISFENAMAVTPAIGEPAALCEDGTIRKAQPGDPVLGIILRKDGGHAQVLVGGGGFGVLPQSNGFRFDGSATPQRQPVPPTSCHHCGAPSPGKQCRYCNTRHVW